MWFYKIKIIQINYLDLGKTFFPRKTIPFTQRLLYANILYNNSSQTLIAIISSCSICHMDIIIPSFLLYHFLKISFPDYSLWIQKSKKKIKKFMEIYHLEVTCLHLNQVSYRLFRDHFTNPALVPTFHVTVNWKISSVYWKFFKDSILRSPQLCLSFLLVLYFTDLTIYFWYHNYSFLTKLCQQNGFKKKAKTIKIILSLFYNEQTDGR